LKSSGILSPHIGPEGIIWGLDLGIRSGYAFGRAGEIPTSGVCELKKRGEPPGVAFGNLLAWLGRAWKLERPAFIVAEEALGLKAMARLGTSESAVRAHYGYHGVVMALADRFGVPFMAIPTGTVRKHFIGAGNAEDPKDAVMLRCHQLKLVPNTIWDYDRADALAVHDWACAKHAGVSVSTKELHLFAG
jgi:crossover junction endodeoxyribonuclease RuvC